MLLYIPLFRSEFQQAYVSVACYPNTITAVNKLERIQRKALALGHDIHVPVKYSASRWQRNR
jgi:hypothetical protein